jgi:hypothetical protein
MNKIALARRIAVTSALLALGSGVTVADASAAQAAPKPAPTSSGSSPGQDLPMPLGSRAKPKMVKGPKMVKSPRAITGTPYHFETGWTPYDGGCQARTTLDYWADTNTIAMKTDVTDPYWFVACRVNAHPQFISSKGLIDDGPTQGQMACAVLDPTCASTRYGDVESFRPASLTLQTLKDFGVPLETIISRIDVQFSGA